MVSNVPWIGIGNLEQNQTWGANEALVQALPSKAGGPVRAEGNGPSLYFRDRDGNTIDLKGAATP